MHFTFCWCLFMMNYIFFIGCVSAMESFNFEDTSGDLIYEPNSNSIVNNNATNPLDIDNSIYNICANVTYKSGNPDIRSALYDCVDNMADAQSMPSYLINASAVPVRVAFNINNLIELNEIDASVSLDCFYRLYWIDQRWNFPTLWEDLAINKPSVLTDGIELRDFIRGTASLKVWLPLIYLNDAISVSFTAETIRLRPGGVFFWSRHAIFTIQQSLLQYQQYPQDTQLVQIKCETYGSSGLYIDLNFTDSSASEKLLDTYRLPGPVSFISNNGVLNIAINPIWRYLYYTTEIDRKNYGSTGSTATKNQLNLYLTFRRLNAGVINRLALPIMLMLLLVGLTFWSEYANRINTTITLLLAVSALYIVIFSSIPMLGYLTDFDKYILAMFMMLVVTVFVHALTSRLMGKVTKYPLRLLLVRILEGVGKICVIPFVLLYFLCTFTDYGTKVGRMFIIILSCIAMCVLGFREFSGLKADTRSMMAMLGNKIEKSPNLSSSTSNSANHSHGNRVTPIELVIFNIYTFGIYSYSTDHYQKYKHNDEVFNHVHGAGGGGSVAAGSGNMEMRNVEEVLSEQRRSEFHEL